MNEHTYDTIVVGAGQAGLAAGYHLSRSGRSFVILDAGNQVGGSWHHRWDSLTLFTPSMRSNLPGFAPHHGYEFLTSSELIAYLEEYVRRFSLPVRLGVHVDGLFREEDGRFRVTSGDQAFLAVNVILATGVHRVPRLPSFAADLADDIVQLHSSDYRNPGQLAPGPVLVVGAGNSGVEIGIEAARTHQVLLSGRAVGEIPIDIRKPLTGRIVFPVVWWVWEHVLTESRKAGRKAQAEAIRGHGEPLIRQKEKDITDAGIERVSRIAGVADGRPRTLDGEVLDVANVIWATGFRPGFDWIDLPGLDSSARLSTERGAVTGQPGLHVLGQEFQYMYNSHTVGGVGKDAAHVVRHLDQRLLTAQPVDGSGGTVHTGARPELDAGGV